MLNNKQIRFFNHEIFARLSIYMNLQADFITADIMNELCHDCHLSPTEAYDLLLAEELFLKIDENESDRAFFNAYFPHMVRHLDETVYEKDLYRQTIRLPEKTLGDWSMGEAVYQPYELIPVDDPLVLADGRVIPQVGFFDKAFSYPVIRQKGVEWMLVTPNEVETMRHDIARAHGKVLNYGLGLGYYTFMVSEMDAVSSVTVVDIDPAAIDLFNTYILPQFPHKEKVRVICDDAFHYAEYEAGKEHYDTIYADIWHDPSDGIALYERFKTLEKYSPHSEFSYWIEKTIQCYRKELI